MSDEYHHKFECIYQQRLFHWYVLFFLMFSREGVTEKFISDEQTVLGITTLYFIEYTIASG